MCSVEVLGPVRLKHCSKHEQKQEFRPPGMGSRSMWYNIYVIHEGFPGSCLQYSLPYFETRQRLYGQEAGAWSRRFVVWAARMPQTDFARPSLCSSLPWPTPAVE